jgi:Ni,Fe-hydrogenase III small subunit
MRWAALLLLGIGLLASPAQAQVPALPGTGIVEQFEVQESATQAVVPVGGQTSVYLTFRDTSRDGPGSASPGAPGALYHRTNVKAIPVEKKAGWQVIALPVSLNTIGGDERQVEVQFKVEPVANEQFFAADVNFTFVGTSGQAQYSQVHLLGNSPGLAAFSAQVSETYLLKPKQIVDVPIKIRNTSLNARSFDMEVVSNPCGMVALTTNGNVVQQKSLEEYTVSLQAPAKKFWYAYDSCAVTVEVRPQDNPAQVRTAIIQVQVAGFYVNPVWIINTVEILLVLLLLLFLLARRKARIEEEILGKPQKPWLIPVEVLYLNALRRKDARAWYVVRHYLMEDEYRSSLLWYKSYKKQTKGSRRKESLVLRQEKAYERWKKASARDIAKPLRQADRFEAKLQRKLDRLAEREHRKQLGKYRNVKGQMEKAHAKQVERASAQYEKAAAKARKKGQPLPEKPIVPRPDYPDEPELVPLTLAEHKWAKKATRHRARMVRKQGDLEVKFEKADARRLRKVRRKVARLARKLDDPEFVAEHPLLQG